MDSYYQDGPFGNLWREYPHPLAGTSPLEMVKLYRAGIEIFLGTELFPEFPFTEQAFTVFDKHADPLLKEGRWKNYRVDEMGDMNVATHTLRQTGISAVALSLDADPMRLSYEERDAMLAAGILHDLGELVTADVTYDEKQASKIEMDIAESKAVLAMLDTQTELDTGQRERLKEIYLQITTSLDSKNLTELLGHDSMFSDQFQWTKLRELFQLYERYGYLVTAIQQYPFPLNGETPELNTSDLAKIRNWNRHELEEADSREETISDTVRACILFKNVATNQIKHIRTASQNGTPSSTIFFTDAMSVPVIHHARKLMNLQLDG